MCHYNKSGKTRMRELDDMSDQKFKQYDRTDYYDPDLETFKKHSRRLIKKMRRERDDYTIIKKL